MKYLQAREKFPEKWNDKFQSELENIEARIAEFEPEKEKYVPPRGTKRLVHARVLRGHRYNPNTGKPLNEPYIQMFSKNEFRVFQESAERLGYQILEILYQPK